ncbi:hypothetical protein Tco_0556332 [Tanacetum coccineum]
MRLLVMSALDPKIFRWEIVYPPPGPRMYIDPVTGHMMKRRAYKRCVPVPTHPLQVKEKSPGEIHDVEPEEDLEEEEEPNEALESGSNTLPLDYTTSDEETYSDLDCTVRSEAKPKDLEDTCESNIRHKQKKIIPQIITQVTNNVNNANGNASNGNEGNNNGCTYKEFLACKPREDDRKGGTIALTGWIEKMESARGREAAMGMTWEEFKAFLMEEFRPSNEMEKLVSGF